MAKKKNTKKPVSKRTTRATLDERNNSLGKTDAPKTRKPRAKKIKPVITTEPAINTVWREGTTEEFLGDTDPQIVSQVVSKVVSWTPPAPELPEDENSLKQMVQEQFQNAESFFENSFEKLKEFAFNYPLIFAVSFSAVLCAVCAGVFYLNRVFRLF